MNLKRIIFFGFVAAILFIAVVFEYFSSNASSSQRFNLGIAATYIKTHGQVAIQGKKGWLFYRPALFSLFAPWPRQNAENIIALRDSLLKDGVQLLVVPVPDKNEVYPELIGPNEPAVVSKQRERFLKQLSNAKVNVLDLVPFFKTGKHQKDLFLQYDSHWNQDGILIAAKEIAGMISSVTPSIPQTLSLRVIDTSGHRYDDLYRLLHGNEANEKAGPYKWESVALPSGEPFKSAPAAPILVFGDSFINAGSDVNANLAAHVARFSGVPTRNFFTLMGSLNGPSMLMDYYRKTEVKPKVIVWAFISCQLMNSFSRP